MLRDIFIKIYPTDTKLCIRSSSFLNFNISIAKLLRSNLLQAFFGKTGKFDWKRGNKKSTFGNSEKKIDA